MATDDARSRDGAVQAGMAAGIAGLTTFLLLHHALIMPIWFIAMPGAVIAVAGGAAVGMAYAELLPHLPRRPWTAIVVAGAVSLILLPAGIIAQLRGPIFELAADGAGRLLAPEADAVAMMLGSLASATVVGAGLGLLVGRRRRSAGTMAIAALAFAIGPGHNIPLLGGTSAVETELVILAAVVSVSSVVLMEGHARLARL